MIQRFSCLAVIIGAMSVPAEAYNTNIAIDTSSCRWDPEDDLNLYTHTASNQYWIENTSGAGATVEVFCPIPMYFGRDSANHWWGTAPWDLSAGEIEVYINSTNLTQARVIQIEETGNNNYSLCAYASGSGVQALHPSPCSTTQEVMLVQVNVPPNGSFMGINDTN